MVSQSTRDAPPLSAPPPLAGKLLLFLPSLFCHASVSVPPLVRPAASRILGSDARLRMLLPFEAALPWIEVTPRRSATPGFFAKSPSSARSRASLVVFLLASPPPSTVFTEALWTAMVLNSRQYGALSNGWPSGFTQVTVDSNMIRAQ